MLIDGDLRRPRLGKLFGLQLTGFSDALLDGGSGLITLDSVVRSSPVPGLSALPGGSEPANISKLLHSTYLDSLIEKARSEYDFTLIDPPPMMVWRSSPTQPQCGWCDSDKRRRRDQPGAVGRSQRASGG